MNCLKQIAIKIHDYLDPYSKPETVDLVSKLIVHTASLELKKGEMYALAPIQGTCGPIYLSGNSLPVFTYKVFEKKIMEFIQVKVEISKPDRIGFISTIDSTTAPERHGEVVETKPAYAAPFHKLSLQLYRYFPYYKRPA